MAEHAHEPREQPTPSQTANVDEQGKPKENLAPQSGQILVDPRPTAPPIRLGNAEYTFPPAAASSDAVLALEPNRYEDATDGPDPQVSMTKYVIWNKPDNSSFIAPIANDETYERKGYVRGAEQDIPDLVAHLADLAKTDEQRNTEKQALEAREKRDQQRRELYARR
jgi:hypothetical protein